MPFTNTDLNDWFLWWPRQRVDQFGTVSTVGPVAPWMRRSPTVRINVDQKTNHVNMVAYMEKAIHYSTFEGDVQMHKVAG